MTVNRVVLESPLYQGTNESISYQLNTLPWGGTPTLPVVTIYDISSGAYNQLTIGVIGSVMPTNSPTIANHIITLSPLTALTADTIYRVEVQFISGGDTWETWFKVIAER